MYSSFSAGFAEESLTQTHELFLCVKTNTHKLTEQAEIRNWAICSAFAVTVGQQSFGCKSSIIPQKSPAGWVCTA